MMTTASIIILFVIAVVQAMCIWSVKCDVESAHRNIGNMHRRLRKTNKDFEI